jgi:TPR repeat protein
MMLTGECVMRRLALFSLAFVCGSVCALAQQPRGPINPPALFEKGMNSLTGTGFSRNDLAGVDSIRRSAELGYAPAQVAMGYFAETGFVGPSDPSQAADFYAKAAAQGDRVAQWVLGRMYFTGIGEPRNLNESERWLGKAANQGDPFGQFLLGSVKLERGDYAAAANWFRRASDLGLPQAQQQLGLLLKEGRGVPADKFEAYVQLLLSFEAGLQNSADDLKRVEAEITNSQIEQAKTRARELQATSSRAVVSRGCTGWQGEFNTAPATPPPDLQVFCR